MPGHLVAVLHSKPPGDGKRTLDRIEIARDALTCETASVANFYPAVLKSSIQIDLRNDFDIWSTGRKEIGLEIQRELTTDVLLGYGVQLATGPHREFHKEQIRWLAELLGRLDLRVWAFGGRTMHPSRWQRIVHRDHPGAKVEQVARKLLVQLEPSEIERLNSR